MERVTKVSYEPSYDLEKAYLERRIGMLMRKALRVFVFRGWYPSTRDASFCDHTRTHVSHTQLLTLVLVVTVWLPSSHAGANLLAAKSILNEHLVEGKDLTIKYSIYNVGNR